MSHKTVITNVEFTSEQAIRDAVEILKNRGVPCKLRENESIRYYSSDSEQYPFVLKLSGKYDVGLRKNERGIYNPVYDSFAGHVGKCLGVEEGKDGTPTKDIGLFQQAYTYAAARIEAKKLALQRNFTVQESFNAATGAMKMVLMER